MFEVNQSWRTPVNLIVLVIFILCIFRGWKKGLFRSVLSLVSMFLSIWLAWHTKEIFSSRFAILPDTGMREMKLSGMDAIYDFFNGILWFAILFVIFRILFFLLDRVLKKLHSIPGVRQVSGILGGIFGGVQAIIWCLLFSLVLSTPLFHNGAQLADDTGLGKIRDVSMEITESMGLPVLTGEAFSTASGKMDSLTGKEKKALNKWLDENGYSRKGNENQ